MMMMMMTTGLFGGHRSGEIKIIWYFPLRELDCFTPERVISVAAI